MLKIKSISHNQHIKNRAIRQSDQDMKPESLHYSFKKLIKYAYYKKHISNQLKLNQDYPPILIYQMGKVGSSTIHHSLEKLETKLPVFHTHFLSYQGLIEGEKLKLANLTKNPKYLYNICLSHEIKKKTKKWKVISLVRDPIARNISAFFQNIRLYYPISYGENISNINIETLLEAFFKHFDHDRPLIWFDREIKPVLGIDIYNYTFPKDIGYRIYHNDFFDLLVIKLEKLNDCIHSAFHEFLGIENFQLINANTSHQKPYAKIYKQFIENINFDIKYIDKNYESKFVNYFYTISEIKKFKEKWRKINSVNK